MTLHRPRFYVKYFQARIIRTTVTKDVEEDVVYYANKALNMFGLTNGKIGVYIEGRINLNFRNIYGRCKSVIVDQTVPDYTLIQQCGGYRLYSHDYLCFALKGLKIGVHWN